MTALMAVAAASPLGFGLGAPLVSKVSKFDSHYLNIVPRVILSFVVLFKKIIQVSYEPAEVKTIQPEVTVQQPEYIYKSVPVAVPHYYAAPVATYAHHALPYAAYPFAYHASPAAVVAV